MNRDALTQEPLTIVAIAGNSCPAYAEVLEYALAATRTECDYWVLRIIDYTSCHGQGLTFITQDEEYNV